MNLQEMDVLQTLLTEKAENQRQIAELSRYSVGVVNRSLSVLKNEGMIDDAYQPTKKARDYAAENKTKRAIILAAGFGMRMIPIGSECPKGLLTVFGEVLIERTIRQLREADVEEIYVVVGFMKERYEYLEEEFGVRLIICNDFTTKNNLYSVAAVKDYLEDAYIVPCDVYCYNNPFHTFEFYSWYLTSREVSEDTDLRVTRGREVLMLDEESKGNKYFGITYLTKDAAKKARKRLEELTAGGRNSKMFWESAIITNKVMDIPARVAGPEDAVEINTYSQLREIEYYNPILQNEVIGIIRKVFNVSYEEIKDITVMKKGLTNRSFLFTVKGEKYIMRIPGADTDGYLDRKLEGRVYDAIRGKGFCDDNVYYDNEKGYKIARFIENSRVCNESDLEEVAVCMQLARRFHEMKITADTKLDLYGNIQYMEDLWEGAPSEFRDYEETKKHIWAMKDFVDENSTIEYLAHGDLNPDNFLVYYEYGEKKIQLIDWEYTGVQDPLTDLAAFIGYRKHDRAWVESVIDLYFYDGCSKKQRLLAYCYIALWGLYNSNWCEYKRTLGVELGDFGMITYQYAKEYYKVFEEEYEKYKKEM
ncbi:MAG: NTP transferase domain-containing protein [Eubacterium sp.]|nr:NTP transferase domain-containing protein [Eubacterium sp.]